MDFLTFCTTEINWKKFTVHSWKFIICSASFEIACGIVYNINKSYRISNLTWSDAETIVRYYRLFFRQKLWSGYRPQTTSKFRGKTKSVSRIKLLDFGMQNWWTFEERAVLAARAFRGWKSLRNKLVLPVKRISYFLHSSLLYVVYISEHNYVREKINSGINMTRFNVITQLQLRNLFYNQQKSLYQSAFNETSVT